jgi:23S rRNA pseudouridine1911/1915/1917 synthase
MSFNSMTSDPTSRDDLHVEIVVQKRFTESRRLDQYVVSRLPQLSRADVQRLIESQALKLNGGKAKASHRVKAGDEIVIDLPTRFGAKPEPQFIPLDILYEDEYMVVLNKQASLIVHPGRGKDNWQGTLTNALQYHFDHLSTCGGAFRPGIVHRLDRDTTGVLVVAKDDISHKRLALQFEHREVKKEYLAICQGVLQRDSDWIDKPIGPHSRVREKMAVDLNPATGRSARTFYEVLERFDGYALVRCKPETGRTHQIRVHLQSLHSPCVADAAYANHSALRVSDLVNPPPEDDRVLIGRQALHAHRLTLKHPRCLEEMELEAPLPEDMRQTVEALRRYRAQNPGS